MRHRNIVMLVVGAALGIALVLSCGHGPSPVDAADQCNCPAAEPPLTGRIVQVTTPSLTIPAQSAQAAGPQCAAGATVIGGGCRLESLVPDIVLSENGPIIPRDGAANPGWYCQWKNPTTADVTAKAIAICLNPAQ